MRLGWIDRLRGVAILGVIWQHFSAGRFQHGFWLNDFGILGFPAVWLTSGWMGVNLFFILSGFVLYLPYARERLSLLSRADALAFCRHRAARLMPLYFVSTAILLVFNFEPRSRHDAIVQPAALATVTFNFSKETFFPAPNWVLWSLGLEVWFTFAFVLLAFLIPRLGIRRVAMPVFLLALVVRLLGTYIPNVGLPESHLNPVRDSLPGRLDDFLVGMILAVWYAKGAAPLATRRFASALVLPTGIVLVTLAAVLWDTQLGGMAVPKWQVVIANNVFQAGVVLVIVSGLGRTADAAMGPVGFVIELSGMMCYSLYVWHGVVLIRVDENLVRFFPAGSPLVNSLLRLAVYAVIICSISWLSYRYVEFGTVKTWRALIPTTTRSVSGPPMLDRQQS
jgi:peptidoglycan/LPS O-acetylase OafA/YrhL